VAKSLTYRYVRDVLHFGIRVHEAVLLTVHYILSTDWLVVHKYCYIGAAYLLVLEGQKQTRRTRYHQTYVQ
jgi:hypothetical protein